MKAIWFIHRGGAVSGPLTSVEVDRRIGAGTIDPDTLIWARGSNEWTPAAQWKDLQSRIEAVDAFSNGRVWYCDPGSGQPAGPLTQNELVQHLKGHTRLEAISLWGTGLARWMPLFEIPEVMDLIGISRREHPRAPLLGQAAITSAGSSVPAQVLSTLTVSVGGFGVKQAGLLTIGDRVQIALKSNDLPSVIHATGKVIYVSRTGEAGIGFLDLSAEAHSILFDHIRRFHETDGPLATAA